MMIKPSESSYKPSAETHRNSGELSYRVESSFDHLEAEREGWDRLALALGSPIYMSYDWVKSWWEFYGDASRLCVFLFHDAERLVGIMPMFIDYLGMGPVRLHVARLVGAHIPPRILNPPLEYDYAESIVAQVATHLLQREQCDLISLGPLSEQYRALQGVAGIGHRLPQLVTRIEVCGEGVHSTFHLPSNLDEYFNSLSKKESKKRRYEMRLLAKTCSPEVEVVTGAQEAVAEFENFVRFHREQWSTVGKPGHFGSWPAGFEFNRRLVQTQGGLGRVRFVRILARDRIVCSHYAFAFGDSYYWELPARVMEPEWRRFSLGVTGAIYLIDVAMKEGKRNVEAGIGHYGYKVDLGAREYTTQYYRLIGSRKGTHFRLALFGWLRWCMLVAYHKTWYRRVQPRLPARFWKPQWRGWLRLCP